MTDTWGRRPLACHHEAGHALARWFFGHGMDRVVVLTVEQIRAGVTVENRRGVQVCCEGLVDAYDIIGWPFGPLPVEGSPEAQAECDRVRSVSRDMELINCLAGSYAEAEFWRMPVAECLRVGGEDDVEHLCTILDAWSLEGSDRRDLKRFAERCASALMRSRKGAAAIRAIADALMEHGELDGEEVARLCREAYGGRQCTYGAWMDRWPPKLADLREGLIPEPRSRGNAAQLAAS